jgi:CrcB protein
MSFVFLGGGLGALSRYALSTWTSQLTQVFWAGTLVVNLLGTLVAVGLLTMTNHLSEEVRLFVFWGLLGAFTTFSTFILDVSKLIQAQDYSQAFLCFFLNMFFGVIIGLFILLKKGVS